MSQKRTYLSGAEKRKRKKSEEEKKQQDKGALLKYFGGGAQQMPSASSTSATADDDIPCTSSAGEEHSPAPLSTDPLQKNKVVKVFTAHTSSQRKTVCVIKQSSLTAVSTSVKRLPRQSRGSDSRNKYDDLLTGKADGFFLPV
ncbi:hypothetical protein Q8A67_025108 [Cirrhinus molitorella]|uniref:Uncharacterized protein n=1 Tax=Cirrhinus molitorella TaxID=172907 RepID=A0AA88NYZ2_9TELE|nr:hypothetical protein Q8A67_025108 [Cirrhinus molitorella]